MKRSKHSLSHYKLLSCGLGELIPIGLVEVNPGDTFQHSTSLLVRFAPMLAPVMHPVHVRVHHWFVPHRLVWDDWEDFITGGDYGSTPPEFPVKELTNAETDIGSLADYLGIATVPTGTLEVSALPFRGYNLIYNEWYRDQDLINPVAVDTGSGVDAITPPTLRRVAWEKDYFTASRPWAQKGSNVGVPVERVPNADAWQVYQAGNNTPFGPNSLATDAGSDFGNGTNGASLDPVGGLQTLISDLRLAGALTRYEEARAMYGSRYTEYLRYLGVRSSDARLQRPEYLGGGKQTIQFSEVLATAEGTNTDVGDLKGHGIGSVRSNRYRRFFEEHGYVFSLMSIRPKTMYVQGLRRTFNRRTKEDFIQKELFNIGMQEILNKEIKADHADPDGVFGYIDRYDDYRREESWVSGEFRDTLNYWHMAREFATDPALNSTFTDCVPTDRIFASSTTDPVYVMARHSIQARRLLPKEAKSFIY